MFILIIKTIVRETNKKHGAVCNAHASVSFVAIYYGVE